MVSANSEDLYRVWIACLHFAIMTITSIGYGDIVPQSMLEYIVGCVCQAFGGILWASSIASICALLTTADPGAVRFYRTMDELNHLVAVFGFPRENARNLRLFFINSRRKAESEAQKELLAEMSPMLRASSASLMYGKQIRSVWYFRETSDQFIAALSLRLRTEVFQTGEDILSDGKLYIINR